jgi:hypothetical protein
MRDVRVIGRDAKTGKLYVALHGERNKGRWVWLPLEHPFINDTADTEGDLIMELPDGIDNAPISAPDQTAIKGKIITK